MLRWLSPDVKRQLVDIVLRALLAAVAVFLAADHANALPFAAALAAGLSGSRLSPHQ